MSGFEGFPPAVFAWFDGLEADNSREYVQRTRDVLDEQVRGGMEALLDELAGDEFGQIVKLFRQHRDLRFSRDKSPYKTRTYGLVSSPERSYYAEVSAPGLTPAPASTGRSARRSPASATPCSTTSRGQSSRRSSPGCGPPGSGWRARRCAPHPAACPATIRASRCCATLR